MKVLTIAAKSLRVFSRDRASLFWSFAFPIFLIIVFSLVFSGQGSVRISVLAVQQDHSSMGNAYFSALDNVLALENVENIQEVEARVLDGKAPAAIIIPAGFSTGQENVRLIYDESRAQVATTIVSIVEGVTKGFFRIQTPLTVESVHGGYKEWNPAQQVIPGIGIMMIMMVGGMGVSERVVIERKTGTFKRNLLAPIDKLSFLGGELLCGFVVGCMQVVIFFALGIFVFGLEITGSILLVALISALVILMGVSFGLIVSTFARSPEAASGTVNAFTFPAAAFGGLWFPVELMPGFMQSVSKVFPTYYAMNAYQDVIVRGKGLLEILPSLSVLIGFILVFFVLGLLLFKWKE